MRRGQHRSQENIVVMTSTTSSARGAPVVCEEGSATASLQQSQVNKSGSVTTKTKDEPKINQQQQQQSSLHNRMQRQKVDSSIGGTPGTSSHQHHHHGHTVSLQDKSSNSQKRSTNPAAAAQPSNQQRLSQKHMVIKSSNQTHAMNSNRSEVGGGASSQIAGAPSGQMTAAGNNNHNPSTTSTSCSIHHIGNGSINPQQQPPQSSMQQLPSKQSSQLQPQQNIQQHASVLKGKKTTTNSGAKYPTTTVNNQYQRNHQQSVKRQSTKIMQIATIHHGASDISNRNNCNKLETTNNINVGASSQKKMDYRAQKMLMHQQNYHVTATTQNLSPLFQKITNNITHHNANQQNVASSNKKFIVAYNNVSNHPHSRHQRPQQYPQQQQTMIVDLTTTRSELQQQSSLSPNKIIDNNSSPLPSQSQKMKLQSILAQNQQKDRDIQNAIDNNDIRPQQYPHPPLTPEAILHQHQAHSVVHHGSHNDEVVQDYSNKNSIVVAQYQHSQINDNSAKSKSSSNTTTNKLFLPDLLNNNNNNNGIIQGNGNNNVQGTTAGNHNGNSMAWQLPQAAAQAPTAGSGAIESSPLTASQDTIPIPTSYKMKHHKQHLRSPTTTTASATDVVARNAATNMNQLSTNTHLIKPNSISQPMTLGMTTISQSVKNTTNQQNMSLPSLQKSQNYPQNINKQPHNHHNSIILEQQKAQIILNNQQDQQNNAASSLLFQEEITPSSAKQHFTANSPGRRNNNLLGAAAGASVSLNCTDLTQILSVQNDDSNICIENQGWPQSKADDGKLHAGEYEIIMSSAVAIGNQLAVAASSSGTNNNQHRQQHRRASRASGTLSQNSNPVSKLGGANKRHGSQDFIAAANGTSETSTALKHSQYPHSHAHAHHQTPNHHHYQQSSISNKNNKTSNAVRKPATYFPRSVAAAAGGAGSVLPSHQQLIQTDCRVSAARNTTQTGMMLDLNHHASHSINQHKYQKQNHNNVTVDTNQAAEDVSVTVRSSRLEQQPPGKHPVKGKTTTTTNVKPKNNGGRRQQSMVKKTAQTTNATTNVAIDLSQQQQLQGLGSCCSTTLAVSILNDPIVAVNSNSNHTNGSSHQGPLVDLRDIQKKPNFITATKSGVAATGTAAGNSDVLLKGQLLLRSDNPLRYGGGQHQHQNTGGHLTTVVTSMGASTQAENGASGLRKEQMQQKQVLNVAAATASCCFTQSSGAVVARTKALANQGGQLTEEDDGQQLNATISNPPLILAASSSRQQTASNQQQQTTSTTSNQQQQQALSCKKQQKSCNSRSSGRFVVLPQIDYRKKSIELGRTVAAGGAGTSSNMTNNANNVNNDDISAEGVLIGSLSAQNAHEEKKAAAATMSMIVTAQDGADTNTMSSMAATALMPVPPRQQVTSQAKMTSTKTTGSSPGIIAKAAHKNYPVAQASASLHSYSMGATPALIRPANNQQIGNQTQQQQKKKQQQTLQKYVPQLLASGSSGGTYSNNNLATNGLVNGVLSSNTTTTSHTRAARNAVDRLNLIYTQKL